MLFLVGNLKKYLIKKKLIGGIILNKSATMSFFIIISAEEWVEMIDYCQVCIVYIEMHKELCNIYNS